MTARDGERSERSRDWTDEAWLTIKRRTSKLDGGLSVWADTTLDEEEMLLVLRRQARLPRWEASTSSHSLTPERISKWKELSKVREKIVEKRVPTHKPFCDGSHSIHFVLCCCHSSRQICSTQLCFGQNKLEGKPISCVRIHHTLATSLTLPVYRHGDEICPWSWRTF